LINPIRRFRHNPRRILAPHIKDGMTVLEPGPGMGFFTIEATRMVGPSGRVVAIEVQKKMIDSLRRRLERRHLSSRTDLRLAQPNEMGTADLKNRVDFVLAFAVVHEMPDQETFFKECFTVLKSGGRILFSEPSNHIGKAEFEGSILLARKVGFSVEGEPLIPSSTSAILLKTGKTRG